MKNYSETQRKKPSTTAPSREADRAQRTRLLTQVNLHCTQVDLRALRATRHYQTGHMYAARLYENSYRPISRRYFPIPSHHTTSGWHTWGTRVATPTNRRITQLRSRSTTRVHGPLRPRDYICLDFWPHRREREREDCCGWFIFFWTRAKERRTWRQVCSVYHRVLFFFSPFFSMVFSVASTTRSLATTVEFSNFRCMSRHMYLWGVSKYCYYIVVSLEYCYYIYYNY